MLLLKNVHDQKQEILSSLEKANATIIFDWGSSEFDLESRDQGSDPYAARFKVFLGLFHLP